MDTDAYLGRGWGFPPTFKKGKAQALAGLGNQSISIGNVEMVAAKEDIDQSIFILLSTSIGERFLQPEYGCNLRDFLFEPMNSGFIGYIKELVSNALLYYEPRINVLKIAVSPDTSTDALAGRMLIQIDYEIRASNSRFNYVYPFFTNEGIEL